MRRTAVSGSVVVGHADAGPESVRPPLDLRVYLVTDAELCGERGVVATAREAAAAGATLVQLRDRIASDAELIDVGRRLRAALHDTGVPLVVNDRVDLVAPIGAAGAHVGQGDLDPTIAREVLGPDAYLGLSVQSVAHVDAALALPAGTVDYLGVGPVWSQDTKPDAAPPCSPEVLADVVRRSPWPCVAIGGIHHTRVAAVRDAGAAGVAVVSAICGQSDVRAATRQLRTAWEAAR
jgi:thiamine-phosphate pyrophosphorylase